VRSARHCGRHGRRWPSPELSVDDALGDDVGEKLLVLWAISRFRDGGVASPVLAELVDEEGRPRFGDPLVEDMMLAAFALGVAWASVGDAPPLSRVPDAIEPRAALRRPHLRLATLSPAGS
jgi:hypothetical protein